MSNQMLFGSVNDRGEEFKGKEGGNYNFGLNHGNFTELSFNPNAGKDGTAGNAVDININVGGKEFKRRIYEVTRVYDKDGNQILDTNSEEYIKKYNQEMRQAMATITHAVKATGVTQEQIDTAFKTPVTTFTDWVNIILSLIPVNYKERELDVFLEYQWKISDGQDKTYLQLPKNMKGGYWLTGAVKPIGDWKEQRQWVETDENGVQKSIKGLRYVDEMSNVHPFTRSQNFMESPKANQQVDGASNATSVLSQATQQPKKATW